MVSNMIGDLADDAGDFVDDAVGEDLAKADKLLQGKSRDPIDIEAIDAEFTKGTDLSTPDGDVPSAAAAPNAVGGSGKPKTSLFNLSKRMEFIHFGVVHRDYVRNFHHDEMNDIATLDMAGITGSRAIYFRAALQREAILLAGFARSTQLALEVKEEEEGAMGGLMQAAQDLLGGPGGTADTAVSTDLKPFFEKVQQKAWEPINQEEISYAALHDAGIKLHEVRAALKKYVREQILAADEGGGAAEASKGLLSDLPVIGEVPIPGKIGEILGFMQGITGKLHEVQTRLILEMLDKMQDPIEKSCMAVTLNAIGKKESPIYPAWFIKPPADGDGDGQPFADYQMDDVLTGDLNKIDELNAINEAIQDGVGSVNQGINDAVEKPMKVVDFLSKDVEPAPGSPFLDGIFEAQAEPGGAYFGPAFLGKVAVGSFGRAMSGGPEIPGFMTGFVGTIVENVFSICAEFLRAVYNKLCCLPPSVFLRSEELVEAGRNNLVFKLIDLVIEKAGIDDLIKEHLTHKLPEPPYLPPGINWPDATLSPLPIIAELKAILSDKLGPYIDPVVEYMMTDLATRLNASRVWAGRSAMSMEVYLAQLPGELALMFRNLFGPLWEFITDTLMGVINNALNQVLGPIAGAVGVAQDGLGKVTGAIADAKKKADQLQQHAKAIEDQIDKFTSMTVSGGDDLEKIIQDGEDLKNLVTSDPFADGPGPPGPPQDDPAKAFPGNRKTKGKAEKIEKAERLEVEENHKWDEARDAPVVPPDDDEDDDGDDADANADGGANA